MTRPGHVVPPLLAVVSLWLLGASLLPVAADGTRVALVALFPSLLGLIPAALVVAGVLGMARVLARRGLTVDPAWLKSSAWLLGLTTLPFLPGLASALPLLLILSGPFKWGVTAAAALMAALSVRELRETLARRATTVTPAAVFLIGFVLYAGLGLRWAGAVGPGGDEPHYLVISQSLLADGDLRIENQHDDEQYLSFYFGPLRPHFLARGIDRVMYSIHAPGTAVIVLPAYAVGGYRGAVLTVALLAAAAGLLIFLTARALAGQIVAVVTWAAVAFTIPFAPHAWLIFPEVPGAFIVALAVWWVSRLPPAGWKAWACRGAAIGILPWLHTRFSVLMAALLVSLAWRLWPRWRDALAMLTAAGVSGVAWLTSFYVMYGKPNPIAPYGSAESAQLDNAYIARGVLGLVFDQEFGFLLYSPAYVLALVGVWRALRSRTHRPMALLFLGALAIYVAGVTRTYMWWGGSSAPARFLVPVVPLMAPFLALGVASARGTISGLAVPLTCWGVAVWAYLVSPPFPRLLINDRDGISAFLAWIQGAAPITATLPSFIGEAVGPPLVKLWPWIAAAGAAAITRVVLRARGRDGAREAVLVPAVFLIFGCAFASLTAPPERLAAQALEGRSLLLADYDPGRHTAVDYPRGTRLSALEVRARSTLEPGPGAPVDGDDGVVRTEPVSLPAGTFKVRVWVAAARTGGTVTADVRLMPWDTVLGRRTGPAGPDPLEMDLVLPLPVDGVTVRLSGEGIARAVRHVEIVPRHVAPRGLRPEERPWAVAAVGTEPGAAVYYLDENAYVALDGAWVRGGRTTTLLLLGRAETRYEVRLRNGAMPQAARVTVDGSTRTIRLAARALERFEVAPAGSEDVVRLEVTCPEGFRPAQTDPGSVDRRFLGCRISIVPVPET